MREEREKRRREKKIKFYVRLGIFLLLCLSIVFLLKGAVFNVSEFIVEGNEYYTDDEVKVMGNCKTGTNILIGIDYKDIKSRLKKDPYFEDVKVVPSFPDKIKIVLTERKQSLAVVYGESYIVLDSNGLVLRKTNMEPKLTIVRGLTIESMELGEALVVEDDLLLREALNIVRVMNENDMYFIEMTMNKNTVNANILENFAVKGAASNIAAVIENGDLQSVVKELFDREIERGVITVSGEDYISFNPKLS